MDEATEVQVVHTEADDTAARRQAEWEAEEVSVAASLPSMFKPNLHHTSA